MSIPTVSPRVPIALCLSLLLPTFVSADTWHVDENVAVPGDGTSWSSAFSNLQDALASADSGDTIQVAAGTYYPDEGGSAVADDRDASFQLIDGVTMLGGFPSGGGSRDYRANETILSGDIDQNDGDDPVPTGGNSYTVVTGSGVTTTAVLDGFIIGLGLADANGSEAFDGPRRAGAGVYNAGGSPSFFNCIFIANSAGFGGAMFNGGGVGFSPSSPSLVNCLIAGNSASSFGGGINNRDSSSPVLISCTITANSAGSSSGGGGIASFSGNPSLTNCIIWNNLAAGDGTTPEASVQDGLSSVTSYAHSLVQNLNPGGTNLDGTDPANDPSFLFPGDPSKAPDTDGDFRLETGSPALDAGDNAANSQVTDLRFNPRVANATIDLGAIEGGFEPIFFDFLYVDQSIDTPGDGVEWSDAFATLNDALDGAVSGQTIRVAQGTYYPDEGSGSTDGDRAATFQLKRGVRIEGGYPSGGGARDLAAHETVLSGDIDQNDAGSPTGENSYSVVTGSGTGPSAILDGFVITGGLANAVEGEFDSPGRAGGGLYNAGGSPRIANCVIRGNFATTGGGGMNIDDSDPTFVNCVVSGNRSQSFGGGFHNRQGCDPVFINTTFSGNAAATNGGAMNNFGARARLVNCIVWNNEAGGTTTTEGASINDSGSFEGTYEFSLIQNFAAAGSRFDGLNAANDPLFSVPLDPAAAPGIGGDFRLLATSFAVDRGDDASNPLATDLLGGSRIQGAAIDLGAFEGTLMLEDSDGDGLSDAFEVAHTEPPSTTALAPDSNDDSDPFTAIEEFAFGLDPNQANGAADAYRTELVDEATTSYLGIFWMIDPAAVPYVESFAEQSSDLGATDAWSSDDTVSISAPAGMGGARSTTAVGDQDKDFLRVNVRRRLESGS